MTTEIKIKNEMGALHPGKILFHEVILPGTITVSELAGKMGVSEMVVLKLIAQDQEIDKTIASKLSQALTTPAEFWLKLQSVYDERAR